MSAIVVVGGQWGDEGKGRIVDLLAEKAHLVARYSAGNNAGHTIINELGEFKLHLVPAGIFYPDKTCIIGNGLVIDPPVLLEEIDSLEERGVAVRGRLFLSDRAHVLMPWHRLLDNLDEAARGNAAIGTTGRGITPAFVDKVGRAGVRIADLVEPEALLTALNFLVPYKNKVLKGVYDAEPLSVDKIFEEYKEYGARLAPFVADTSELVQKALDAGEKVLLEGAQGSLLDLDFGTYEYVTSSVPSSLAAGAALGIGIGPTQIRDVLGVFKAYNTRVGAGPFPTELHDETATLLREGGPRPEYGSTTGRPRRCGWFDAVAARYSARINGLTGAALTRLDILDALPSIKVCTAYDVGGKTMTTLPASGALMAQARPIYEELPGWSVDTSGCRRFDDLPAQAQDYVRYIQEKLGTPICIISVGPEREQAISVKGVM
ncbi:MAG TPA: adenylosuccinate synthase [Dehalococcoidia bacterium]|nr:adenylosuccinate synthase [Dehalococcoidia bacterium]